jgi:mannose-6-phosphate isomerase-like protein (cupin superfamily)
MVKKLEHDTNKYLKTIRSKSKNRLETFIRGKKLSIGIQLLKKGEDYGDPHHHNDEVYFILKGHAHLHVGGNDFKVSPGMAFFVPHQTIHRFYNVSKELVFLFIFGGEDD